MSIDLSSCDYKFMISVMLEISEDRGWNNCIEYLLKHLDEFQESLSGGQYDYFPYEEIEDKLKKIKDKT